MKTLRDYIRLFIKEKYLTNNTKKINVLLDSTKCIEVDTIIVNKNNFSLSCEIEIENLLDLPVTKVRFLCDKKLSKIDLEEIEDVSSGKIQINISPRLKDIGDDFILYFDCMLLPKIYTDSFLYKLDIFNPSLYHALKKHNNTVISYINYNLAIEYIHEHKDELSELYNIYEDSDHVFLEKIYELKNNTGGAGGFEYGMKKALEYDCDYVWIMDDDAYPRDNCLERLFHSFMIMKND